MKQRGFTLLELMIVIAIIAIIAAIAIPNLRDARMAANEANAIAALRSYHSAQTIYREQDKDGNGTLDYGRWDHLYGAGLISWAHSGTGEVHSGYKLSHLDGNSAGLFVWCAYAWPDEPMESGVRYFYVNQRGVVYYTINYWDPLNAPEKWFPVGK